MAFTPSFDELRADVETELDSFLRARATALPEAGLLIDEIARMVDSGGKRIRPLFCYWGFRAAGGRGHDILSTAAALELLHTFAIVHDDIMDAADQRRGRPTVTVEHGPHVALLVGDLALVLADELFMSSRFPQDALLRAFAAYSRMRQEVIAGQFLDLTSSSTSITEERARRIAILKSGRYSVQEPLLIGATLGEGSQELLDGLAGFGSPLGEAFQLRDDLLGTFGDRSLVGKPVDSDIREGKRHFLYARTIQALAAADRDFFVSRWGAGDSLAPEEVVRLRQLVESSGARRDTEELLERLTAEARSILDRISCDPPAGEALAGLVELSVGRDS